MVAWSLTPFALTADADTDDEDDSDSDVDSCASDDTEKRPAIYSDLSKRFHAVSVKVKPNQLLTYNNPIFTAIQENDVEAFTQIADVRCRIGDLSGCVAEFSVPR